jgi:hypothetical protein
MLRRSSPGHGSTYRPTNPPSLKLPSATRAGSFIPGCSFSPRRCPTCRVTGVPKLPVFVVGNLTDADRQLLGTHLPPECLQGTFFKLMPAKSVSSLFND